MTKQELQGKIDDCKSRFAEAKTEGNKKAQINIYNEAEAYHELMTKGLWCYSCDNLPMRQDQPPFCSDACKDEWATTHPYKDKEHSTTTIEQAVAGLKELARKKREERLAKEKEEQVKFSEQIRKGVTWRHD